MNKIFNLVWFVFLTVLFSVNVDSPYLVDEVKESINDLLDFEKIADIIDVENDKHQFYQSVAHAIYEEHKYLDSRFNEIDVKFIQYIRKFEEELGEEPYIIAGDKPELKYTYKPLTWSEKAKEKNVFQTQANIIKRQYIETYEYYRLKLKSYKDYLYYLRDLRPELSEEIEEFITQNEDIVVDMTPQVDFEYYKDMNALVKGLQLFKNQIDPDHSMRVLRNNNGRVSSIYWGSELDSTVLKRVYVYKQNGLLDYFQDSVNGIPKFKAWFGENSISNRFFDYIFSPGFVPHYYDHLLKIFYTEDGLIESYQFESMNGYSIGNILMDYDEKNHLINESWYLGNSDTKIREFESIFDPKTAQYEVIEKDKFGNIVTQEIVSSKIGNTK